MFLSQSYEFVYLEILSYQSLMISVEEDDERNDDSIPPTNERTKLLLLLR